MLCLRCRLPIEGEGFVLNHLNEGICLEVALAKIEELKLAAFNIDERQSETVRQLTEQLFKYAEFWADAKALRISELKAEIEEYRAIIQTLQEKERPRNPPAAAQGATTR